MITYKSVYWRKTEIDTKNTNTHAGAANDTRILESTKASLLQSRHRGGDLQNFIKCWASKLQKVKCDDKEFSQDLHSETVCC